MASENRYCNGTHKCRCSLQVAGTFFNEHEAWHSSAKHETLMHIQPVLFICVILNGETMCYSYSVGECVIVV